jgi:hypothetical protein
MCAAISTVRKRKNLDDNEWRSELGGNEKKGKKQKSKK